jgi:hypothetical protein
MKRLAFLSFTVATLIAPIQVHAQQCVTFPQNLSPEAEVRYLISHPDVRVCPSPNPDPAGQTKANLIILRQMAPMSVLSGSTTGRAVGSVAIKQTNAGGTDRPK